MSISTSIPRSARPGRSHPLRLVAVAAVIAAAAWWSASQLVGSGGRPSRPTVSTDASVLRSLSPQERQYVTGIASLSDAQLAAAFGADRISGVDPTLTSLRPNERRYVRAIASMSYEQLAAAFGTGR
jgi:hypothetical protein